jgi:peptidoglycan biosynthesis protein MviN/MurJ (putative lipid II flippase)
VRVILGSGLFNWEDTRLTAAALALLVFSSLFQCMSLLFIRGFYSAGFTKKPFFINLASTVFLVAGTWLLVKYFYFSTSFQYFIENLLKVEGLSGTVVLMLPLGFSIASIINGLTHLVVFEKTFPGFVTKITRTFTDCLTASLAVALGTYASLNVLVGFIDTTLLVGILTQGLVAGIVGVVCGVLTLVMLKNQELQVVWSVVKRKFWQTRVIATDQEIV